MLKFNDERGQAVTEAKSILPQLPPRPTLVDHSHLSLYSYHKGAEPYIAALEAENESLKAKLKTAGICELAVDNPNLASYAKEWEGRADKAEAERDQALEVIREYRKIHPGCCIRIAGLVNETKLDGRCPTCIKADALLSKEETK